jgi:dethiobiotin synthetase
VADVAADLGFPVLIVARMGLGTINHTLLTIEAARARQLCVCGVVLSEAVPLPVADVSWRTNPRELQRRCDVPVLAVVRHVPGGDLLEVEELRRIPWKSLPQPKVSAVFQE